MGTFPYMAEYFGVGGSEINEEHDAVQQNGQGRCSNGVEVWLIALMMSFHNPHKKYERKLKAHIETRTPYMLYKRCRFGGAKINPGKGIRFIASDSYVSLSSSCPKSKCKHYFHNHLKPAKLTWTNMYWKKHKN
ncbi:hypothetical protein ZWY2020_021216, partial [Hordeum vulgare]